MQLARACEAHPYGLPDGSQSNGYHTACMFYKKFYFVFFACLTSGFVVFVVNFFLLRLTLLETKHHGKLN